MNHMSNCVKKFIAEQVEKQVVKLITFILIACLKKR
jgi:hypothetical protein